MFLNYNQNTFLRAFNFVNMNKLKLFNKKFVNLSLIYPKFMSTSNVFNTNNCLENDYELSFDDFKSLAVNKQIETKIKLILNEYQYHKTCDQHRDNVPTRLSFKYMKLLIECQRSKRKKHVWIDSSDKRRLELMYLMKKLELNDGKNQLITPLLPYEFDNLYVNRLKNASLFGQNVVFDISFDSHMSTLECKNLAEQLNRIYRFNKYKTIDYSANELPFNLNICNVSSNEKTAVFLNFLFPEMSSNKSFVNITEKSYLDLFPKEQLIYLSPHAKEIMTEYDPNAVFIIGGIVDRRKVLDLSYPKAKQQNIRSMRLPIDSLIKKTNIQSLDAVFQILYEFNVFGINEKTLNLEKSIRKHIPNYKLKSIDRMEYEKSLKEDLEFDYLDFEEDLDQRLS